MNHFSPRPEWRGCGGRSRAGRHGSPSSLNARQRPNLARQTPIGRYQAGLAAIGPSNDGSHRSFYRNRPRLPPRNRIKPWRSHACRTNRHRRANAPVAVSCSPSTGCLAPLGLPPACGYISLHPYQCNKCINCPRRRICTCAKYVSLERRRHNNCVLRCREIVPAHRNSRASLISWIVAASCAV